MADGIAKPDAPQLIPNPKRSLSEVEDCMLDHSKRPTLLPADGHQAPAPSDFFPTASVIDLLKALPQLHNEPNNSDAPPLLVSPRTPPDAPPPVAPPIHPGPGGDWNNSTVGPTSASPPADISLLIIEDDVFAQFAIQSFLDVIKAPGSSLGSSPGSSPSSVRPSLRPLTVKETFAADAAHGYDLLAERHFDIAICDIHLPGSSNGLDVSWAYQQLRYLQDAHGDREGPGAIMIACTGDENVTQYELEMAGFHDLLRKPGESAACSEALTELSRLRSA